MTQAKPLFLGLFVIAGIVLTVGLIFMKGNFAHESYTFVIYVDSSVKGLDVGAPVDFDGVRVGSVTDIILLLDPQNPSSPTHIKVLIKIEAGRAQKMGGSEMFGHTGESFKHLIDMGLRAKLGTQSLLTGKLYVALDFAPNEPAITMNIEPGLVEIPTAQTDLEKIQATFSEIVAEIQAYPLGDFLKKVDSTLDGVDKFVNSGTIEATLQEYRNVATDLRALIARVDTHTSQTNRQLSVLLGSVNEKIGPITESLNDIINNTKTAVDQLSKIAGPTAKSIEAAAQHTASLIQNVDTQLDPLVKLFEQTTKSAQEAMDQAAKALASIDNLSSERSPLRYELLNTMKELTRTARSIRVITEYLEQHPESLIRGKGKD